MLRFVCLLSILLACLWLPGVAAERALWIGMERGALVESLGSAHSQVLRGDREILIYSDGSRFELDNGKVVSIEGYKGRIDLGPPNTEDAGAKQKGQGTDPKDAAAPAVSATSGQTPAPGQARKHELEVRPVERQVALPTYGEAAAPDAGKLFAIAGFLHHLHDPRWHGSSVEDASWLSLLGGLLGRMALCLLGLRLAARVHDRVLSWGEVAAIAAIEVGVRLLLLELLYVLLAYTMPFYAIELIMMVIQTMLVFFWLKEPDWWAALRIVATAKAAIIAITFALFSVMLSTATA